VEFPLTPLKEVEGVSLICLRKVGAMDTVRIILNSRPEVLNPYVSAGSPFRIKWYAKGELDEFVGYIHSFRPHSDGYQQKSLIIGISAAYPMFNEPGRTYQRYTIDNVVREVCDEYRFQLEIEPHSIVQEQILQQDGSDWSMLQRLAQQWGYTMFLDRVTMVFRPLHKVLEDNYRLAEKENTSSILSDRTSGLIEFKPSFSALNKVPHSKSIGEGVDPIDVTRIRWIQPTEEEPMFQEVSTQYAVESQEEGESIAVGAAARSRFPYTADACIQSPIGKKPLDVYQIDHEGERMTWAVQSVRHIVTGANYIGEAVLGSDGKDYVSDSSRKGTDVSALMRMSRASTRSDPILINTKPYFSGSGANVVVKDQRWKAKVVSGYRIEEVA
jgi:hypothetical protein